MKTEHIEKFIEDMLAGGWQIPDRYKNLSEVEKNLLLRDNIHEWLIDPEAWNSVWNIRRWSKKPVKIFPNQKLEDDWKVNMHRFIDHLADGKNINEALGAINN